jgi:peptide/nickel transport system substrate-binding protein
VLAKRFMTPSGLVIRIFLASALLFFLLGCGTSDTPSTDGEATEAAPVSQAAGTPVPEAELTDAPTPAGGPRYGGVVNIQKHGPPGKLDPHPSVAGLDASEFAHVYDNLVQYNPFEPTDEIVPDLAESWDISDDGLVFTFHLHDHVVWTDGEPFNADDVLFSLERIVEPGKPRPRAGLIRQYYESSKVVDDHTIEVTLAFPAAAFLNVLGMEYVKILPRHVVEAGVDINLGENMVGTGPYKFVKYVKGNRLEFEKNQDYWREGLPYLDGINKIIISDIGRIIAAFKAGQVMTSTIGWTNLTVRDYLKLAEDAEEVLSVHRLCCDQAGFGLMMNVNKSPTDDARVRRAIFVAVDREAINQANIAGAGTVGSPVQTWAGLGMSQEELVQQPGFRMAADGSKHPDDLQMARDLLAEAGYADGLDITLRFSLTEGQNPDSAALIKDQLKDVGINVTLEGLEYQTSLEAWKSEDFELGIQGNGYVVPDPDVLLNAFYMPQGTRNYSHWSHPQFVDLYNQQSRATDPAERLELISQMENIILFEDTPAVMLYYQPFFWLVNHKLKNFAVPLTIASTYLQFDSIWLDE